MATLATSPNVFFVPELRRSADSNRACHSRYALEVSTCSTCGRRALFKRISSLRSAVPALRDVNAGNQDGMEHVLDANYIEYEIQQRLNSDAERDGHYLEFEIEERLRRDIGPPFNTEEHGARFEEREGSECVKDDQNDKGHLELPASLQIVENLRTIKAPQVQKDMQMEESESKFEKALKHLTAPVAYSGQIFLHPNPKELSHQQRSKRQGAISGSGKLFPAMDATWSTPDHPVVRPAASTVVKLVMKKPLPAGAPTKFYLAELALSKAELQRLNRAPELSMCIYQRVTPIQIRAICRIWATCEIVRIRTFEHTNMDRLHEELEAKTGGLVIRRGLRWLKLYRGRNYCARDFHSGAESVPGDFITETLRTEENVCRGLCVDSGYLMAMDKMLEGLGPRYADWQGCSPVPVDGDRLPQVDFTFKAPYRLFPHSLKAELQPREAECLRRLGQAMPPQFVIGRSNGLFQGLANAIVKLWEKVEVVRVAFKWLPEKAELERTVHQLELLTGGCSIYQQGVILLYRGKDFLPAPIATAIEERDSVVWDRRMPGTDLPSTSIHADVDISVQDQAPKFSKNDIEKRLRRLGRDLDTVLEDKAKFERDLEWLADLDQPREQPKDRETITEEERHIFKEIGLHSPERILIGPRGAFAGTVESMHEAWRYREVIKLIYIASKGDSHVQEIASFLEIESGGILVGIFPMVIERGPALIFYRGKNYMPPYDLRPKHLLNKREAYDRFMNEDAIKACDSRILELEAEIYSLRQKLLDTDEEMSGQHGAIIKLGAIIRTEPLTTTERLILRKRALAMGLIERSQFSFDKGRSVWRVIRAIRLHLTIHELVTVKKPSLKWFSLVKLIEKDTGAAFVCSERNNLLFYYNPRQDQLV